MHCKIQGIRPKICMVFFSDYKFFYINDYQGQIYPEMEEIIKPLEINHVCNFFLIHKLSKKVDQWKENFIKLKNDYRVKVS